MADFWGGYYLRVLISKIVCIYWGSGKTLAFGIPILTHILGHKSSQEASKTTKNTTKNNATEALETGDGTSELKKPLLATGETARIISECMCVFFQI